MKKKESKNNIDKNFFREMSYELAGDIGAIDNEEMMNNNKLVKEKEGTRKIGFKNLKIK